jgi:hypothetical protein
MTIRYDRSKWATVLVCSDCGWQDLAVSQQAAWSLAADHERRAHPDQRGVREAARMRATRANEKFLDDTP